MPKVSIIVPVYKVEMFLRECLDRIKLQTFADWECLLIDDGSPDDSGKICDEYALADSRFRVFHVNNGGVSSARNIGLDNMAGEWVMFVDSDDVIAENALEICVKYVEMNSLDILQFSYTRKKDDLCKIDGENTDVLDLDAFVKSKKLLVSVWGNLLRASIVQSNNLSFDSRLKLAEDQLFIFNFMNKAKRFQKIGDCLYWYRNNLSSATYNQKTDDMICSLKTLVGLKKSSRIWSAYIDRINVVFLIKVILNNDVSFGAMKKVIRDAEISDNRLLDRGLPMLFSKICSVSLSMAILLVKFRGFMLRSCNG